MSINFGSLFVRILGGTAVALFVSIAIVWSMSLPTSLKEPVMVQVEKGSTLSDIAYELKEKRVVRSATFFQSLVLLKGGEKRVVAGEYRFAEPQSAYIVADRLLSGDYGIELLTVTIPEGLTSQQIGTLLESRLPDFDGAAFAKEALRYEGKLFPATYTFSVDTTSETVVKTMLERFDEYADTLDDLRNSDRTLHEVITLASIIEREANTLDTKRIISGILQRRLKEEMPLQVDAAFLYLDSLAEKTSATLTRNDLAIDSPYNTYTNVGLPPTPIANPGRDSIEAVLNPIETKYYFYLNDLRGNMYYASDFEGHRENRKYLNI